MMATHERLWGGRFATSPDEATLRFMAGRDVTPAPAADSHLIDDDLWASAAHVVMLARQGVIPEADARALLDGIARIGHEHAEGVFYLDPAREDVHTNIEMRLTEIAGTGPGGRIHTGRSRNDQVVTAMRLYLRAQALSFAGQALDLARVLVGIADDHLETVMPGFTHHQPATPTTLGHILASYAEATVRDAHRFLNWLALHNDSPLGGAAGYGATIPLDRALTASYLAFDHAHLTSIDPLTTRGEPETDLAMALAAFLKHLAGIAQTIILLGSPGYGVVQLSPSYGSGSSIMPQKGNPDTMEAIKARAAVAAGIVSGLLGIGAAAFVGYNRDTQWSKYLIIDLVAEAVDAPVVLAGALSAMTVHAERGAALADGLFVGSTALMENLVLTWALPLRQAKHVVETAVRLSEEDGAAVVTGPALRAALLQHGVVLDDAPSDEHVAAVQRPLSIIMAANSVGGPAPSAVSAALAVLDERIDGLAERRTVYLKRITAARARLRRDGDAL